MAATLPENGSPDFPNNTGSANTALHPPPVLSLYFLPALQARGLAAARGRRGSPQLPAREHRPCRFAACLPVPDHHADPVIAEEQFDLEMENVVAMVEQGGTDSVESEFVRSKVFKLRGLAFQLQVSVVDPGKRWPHPQVCSI